MEIFREIVHSVWELSNFSSSLTILSFIGAIFAIILKAITVMLAQRQQIHNSTRRDRNLQVPRLNMTKVHIPFTFKLNETAQTSSSEVRIIVSSQVSYTIQAFWCVSIKDLKMFLWKPWDDIKKETFSQNNKILVENFHQKVALNVRNKSPHSEEEICIKCPEQFVELGNPPRTVYPLVIFLIRDDQSMSLHDNEAILLVSVVHLKDSICPLPTSILTQFLKQVNGQLSCLKQLYLATGDVSTDQESQPTKDISLSFGELVGGNDLGQKLFVTDGPQIKQVCVVCHNLPLSRALLPCRHTCICAVCFVKIQRCPMCRAPITSYFCIRSEEYVPESPQNSQEDEIKQSNHWIDALNDKLTDIFGFR